MSFPSTGVLDTFDRADENPLSGGGNWTSFLISSASDSELDLVSNTIRTAIANTASAYWTSPTFGPDSEAYFTVATKPSDSGSVELFVRVSSPGTSGVDGYQCIFRRDDVGSRVVFSVYRWDNNVFTQLGSSVNDSDVMADGEKYGVEAIGSDINGYRNSGSWVQKISRSDATYSSAGYIGPRTGNSTARLDDFGGGTVVAAPVLALVSVAPRVSDS